MIMPWEDYLQPRRPDETYRSCLRRCRSAFDSQRATIQRVFDARQPGVVACLGAGVLNDIPYWRFVQSGATLHLVDWLPGVVEFGLKHAVVQGAGTVAPQCVYCRLTDRESREYCCSYRRAGTARAGVCDAFAASPAEPDVCLSFRKGRLPQIHRRDVTGGYADAFGAGVADVLAGATTWRQALKRATALANRIRRPRERLPIPSGSVDLAVSSMVISQFEHEPYSYFSRQALAALGLPTADEERRLRPALEKLRTTLLHHQIEGHCAEIERILAPGGRCFLAFEMFHRNDGDDAWYLVEEMHGALIELDRRFDFDIDGCPSLVGDAGFETEGGTSVVYHLLLAPKESRALPARPH